MACVYRKLDSAGREAETRYPCHLMIEFLRLILHIIASFFKPRTKLVAEILILRQQLNVLRRQVSKRPQLSNTDRLLFVWLYRWFPSVLSAIAILRPETIIRWHRGVPVVLARAITQTGWQAENLGVDGIAAIDLFVLPTITFRLLYCLVILRHGCRLWVSFGVTTSPTAEWISRQIIEAFPWDSSPRYLIRDRDTAYGVVFRQRLRPWAFGTSRLLPDRRGRIRTSRD